MGLNIFVVFFYLVIAAASLLITWAIIRHAVLSALRAHVKEQKENEALRQWGHD